MAGKYRKFLMFFLFGYTNSKNRYLYMLAYLLLGYIVFILFLWGAQRSFIYFPDHRAPELAAYRATDMDVVTVTTRDGLTLSAWYKAPEGDKPVIALFHGNASHMGISAWKVRSLMDQGYGALLPSYRGYAGNPGKPTEKGLYLDGHAFLSWLENEQKIEQNRIIIYGESLGTGIAVELASADFGKVRAVILESPYTSFVDMARRQYFFVPFVSYLVRDRYNSLSKIGDVNAPLLIVSGKLDMVVPVSMGRKLFQAANDPKYMVEIPAAGHNDLYMHGADRRVLHFLSGL